MSQDSQKIIHDTAMGFALANPLLKTPEEQRAAVEGFLNGVHWAFKVVITSTEKWTNDAPAEHPPTES
jgi:hypothetical protein